MSVKKPGECKSAEEIRNEIDRIDRQIISLFSERHTYIEEIVKFKHDENGIVAQERKEKVINQRKTWAAESGLNPETFKEIYTLLVESNIKHEMKILKSNKSKLV
jgi:isochorismate pyruvate lyase